MKATIDAGPEYFKPFTLNIRFESPQEVEMFRNIMTLDDTIPDTLKKIFQKAEYSVFQVRQMLNYIKDAIPKVKTNEN